MQDVGSISAMIGVIKEAAVALKAVGKIDLYEKILDLHGRINELQSDLQSKDNKIRLLEEAKNELERMVAFSKALTFNGVWYLSADDPNPFCPNCWEARKIAVHLQHVGSVIAGERKDCSNCQQTFIDTSKAQRISPRLVPKVTRYSAR